MEVISKTAELYEHGKKFAAVAEQISKLPCPAVNIQLQSNQSWISISYQNGSVQIPFKSYEEAKRALLEVIGGLGAHLEKEAAALLPEIKSDLREGE